MTKHLVIFSDPNYDSFIRNVFETVVDFLSEERGHDVATRDLYAQGFKPVLDLEDLENFKQGVVSQDIKDEQRKIMDADVITFVSPLWWGSMPAMLKGYIERVFSYGFAYEFGEDPLNPIGLLKNKKVLLLTTIGGPDELYKQKGMYEAIGKTWDWAVFEFCGMNLLGHLYFPGIHHANDQKRRDYLETLKAQMRILIDN